MRYRALKVNGIIVCIDIALVEILSWVLLRNAWAAPDALAAWLRAPFEIFQNRSQIEVCISFALLYFVILALSLKWARMAWLSYSCSVAFGLVWISAVYVHIVAGLIG